MKLKCNQTKCIFNEKGKCDVEEEDYELVSPNDNNCNIKTEKIQESYFIKSNSKLND